MSEPSPMRVICRQCFTPIDTTQEDLETGVNCPVCDLLVDPVSTLETSATDANAEIDPARRDSEIKESHSDSSHPAEDSPS